MKLSEKALQQLKTNMHLRNRLTLELEKHPDTIKRWIAVNDERLTMAHPLQIIAEETGLPADELLTTAA